ncbi:MAG: glycosyltransferase family 29 protein [Pseudomonadota bacterium]
MIGFYLARLRRDEAALARYSSPLPLLDGRHVALVGNARKLGELGFGAEIDASDLIVRMNSAPLPDPSSHGTRTDWHATSIPLSRDVLRARGARRVLWMTPKRKRLPYHIATSEGFYLHPATEPARLHKTLGARPSTGAMLIDLLARTDARSITLYGFDFFASLSLSGRREAAQTPHDFDAERIWAEALMARDARITLCGER